MNYEKKLLYFLSFSTLAAVPVPEKRGERIETEITEEIRKKFMAAQNQISFKAPCLF